MNLKIDPDLSKRFLDLKVINFSMTVKNTKSNSELEKFKENILKDAREKYNLESLKDVPVFRAYRNFFWKIGIDPTKNRPATEALIRRILAGKTIPNINTLVDTYNLASIKSEVALAVFDENKLRSELTMRSALKEESFLGIGMDKPVNLDGGEVVISDSNRLVAMYPHRDADFSKVTEETENILILICGVPGIPTETLQQTAKTASEYITRFCSGTII